MTADDFDEHDFDQVSPALDPDPHHKDRVRLHHTVEALRRNAHVDRDRLHELREIARMWTTYAPHDLLGSEIEARAREEIERRGESVDGDAE